MKTDDKDDDFAVFGDDLGEVTEDIKEPEEDENLAEDEEAKEEPEPPKKEEPVEEPEEPVEEKKLSQSEVDKLIGARLGEDRRKHELSLEQERSRRIALENENKILSERMLQAAQQQNNLIDEVKKDELMDIDDQHLQKIDLNNQQQEVQSSVFMVKPSYDHADAQRYQLSGQQILIDAMDEIGDMDKINLIQQKYQFFEQSGEIPLDVLLNLDGIDDKVGFIQRLVNDPEMRNNVQLAGYQARNSGNPGNFGVRLSELAKINDGDSTSASKKAKPKVEKSPGRKPGTIKNTDDIESPIIDLR